MTDQDPTEPGTSDPTEWLDRHGDALFRYAVLRVRSRDVAEELVQETFVAALRAREGFEGRSSLRTWLVAILRRKIVDHIRRRRRSEVSPDGTDALDGVITSGFDRKGHWKSRQSSWATDPARTFVNREFWAVFDDCVAKLPANLADTFYLRELEELGSDELCKILGITASNLWVQLHRARALLRHCLETNWFTADRSS